VAAFLKPYKAHKDI